MSSTRGGSFGRWGLGAGLLAGFAGAAIAFSAGEARGAPHRDSEAAEGRSAALAALAEIGPDDQVVALETAGWESPFEGVGQPRVAHDPERDEYLVVWMQEVAANNARNEVFVRKVDGKTGVALGEAKRVSSSGQSAGPDVFAPRVEYAPERDEYLVGWVARVEVQGTRIGTPFAQRLRATDLAEVGPDDFAISTDVTPGENPEFDVTNLELAWAGELGVYLAVWTEEDGDTAIWCRRVAGDGTLVGGELEVSTFVPGSKAFVSSPAVVFHPSLRDFVVGYYGRPELLEHTRIWVRRVDGASGVPEGEARAISRVPAGSTTSSELRSVQLTLNGRTGEIAAAWKRAVFVFDGTSGSYRFELLLQRLDPATLAELGADDLLVESHGSDSDARRSDIALGYSAEADEYLLLYQKEDGDHRVLLQRLDSTDGAPLASALAIGLPSFAIDQLALAVAHHAAGGLAVWNEDHAPPVRDAVLSQLVGSAAGAACAATGSLCLGSGDRFQVEVSFRTGSGQQGNGKPVQLTADTGFFWFFSDSNVEIVVKVLDGCGINDRFWVFAGGLTDVEAELVVRDLATGEERSYANPAATPFQPIQDTAAFATCAEGVRSPAASRLASLPGADPVRLLASEIAQDLEGLARSGAGAAATQLAEQGPDDQVLASLAGPEVDVMLPQVAFDSTRGQYLVAWAQVDGGGTRRDVYVRRVDAATGLAVGEAKRVSGSGSAAGLRVFVTDLEYARERDEFLVVWQASIVLPGDRIQFPFAQRLRASDLQEVGPDDIAITTDVAPGLEPLFDAFAPVVAWAGDLGHYLAVWIEESGGDFEVWARRVSGDGAPLGSDIPLTSGSGYFGNASPAVVYDRVYQRFVVAWLGVDSEGEPVRVWARLLAGDTGAPLGAAVPVSQAPAAGALPTLSSLRLVRVLRTGELAAAWKSVVLDGPTRFEVKVQRLEPSELGQVGADDRVVLAGSALDAGVAVSTIDVAYSTEAHELLLLAQAETGDGRVLLQRLSGADAAPVGGALPIGAAASVSEVTIAAHESAAGGLAVWSVRGATQADQIRTQLVGAAGACNQSESLCLGAGDRFRVDVTFDDGSGSSVARPVPLTEDTGYFWFFSQSNVEIVVKVLDGCGLNDKFWVFAGGLTDVEAELVVTDLATDVVRTYANPPATPFEPIQDTAAFDTCP